jgi:hypothetical protein
MTRGGSREICWESSREACPLTAAFQADMEVTHSQIPALHRAPTYQALTKGDDVEAVARHPHAALLMGQESRIENSSSEIRTMRQHDTQARQEANGSDSKLFRIKIVAIVLRCPGVFRQESEYHSGVCLPAVVVHSTDQNHQKLGRT